MNKKVIVSMTTIPCRQKRLAENVESLLTQSYNFNVLLINIDDNLSDEEYQWYEDFAKQDYRIVINKSEAKWRSCNKLLPALTMYPDDIIITVDDDIYYPKDSLKELIKIYVNNPDCIIVHEINPLDLRDDKINYFNAYDIKMGQKEWGKYLSNCALFPPKVFEGTDLFDYDKMMYCTDGNHDELWFWVNSTLNNIKVIASPYIRTFNPDVRSEWQEDEYRLCKINDDSMMKVYADRITELYGKRLLHNITNNKTEFILTTDNVQHFCATYQTIKSIFYYGFTVDMSRLTNAWRHTVNWVMQGNVFKF